MGNGRKNAGATVPSMTLSCIITVIMITKRLIPLDKVSSGMEQSPWKANCFSPDQESPCLSLNLKDNSLVHNSLPSLYPEPDKSSA